MGSFDADDEDDKVEEEEEEEEELALALDSGSDAPFSPQLFGRVRAAVEEESSSFRFAFAGGGVLEFRPLFLFGAMSWRPAFESVKALLSLLVGTLDSQFVSLFLIFSTSYCRPVFWENRPKKLEMSRSRGPS